VIFPRNRHELLPLLFGGGVEGDGKFGADRFAAEFGDLRDDAGGGDRDAAGGEGEARGVEQNPGGFNDIRQVQQRLTLPHHDDVEASALLAQSVFARDEEHLADDLAGGEAAFQAHESGHAELAIHRAAHLAGDADGVALAFGHEHGFDGAAVGQAEQVTARTVDRFEKAVDGGEPQGVPFGEFLAQADGQGGDLREVRGLAVVEGLVNLAGAVPGLIGAEGLTVIGQVHAHERLGHSNPV
jgi:hypothetical protein